MAEVAKLVGMEMREYTGQDGRQRQFCGLHLVRRGHGAQREGMQGRSGELHAHKDMEVLMEGIVFDASLVSLAVMDAVPGIVALGMTSACLVVLTVGALVSGFKALVRLIGR